MLILLVSCKKQKECESKGFIYYHGNPVPNIEFGYSLVEDQSHSSEFRIGKTDNLGMFKIKISSTDEDNIIYFGKPESMLATRKYTCDNVNRIDTIHLQP
ncbi:hypothetical protein HNQ02_003697 [Flavobacterium sp. 7E]|uniref:hypothetical protein n=1 Tax=Flavobacterium sp. 7E TaxID=2735898 RepID=UPI00156E1E70|nr:hypothetical protein [Flavobacterium sp. 7E]NRS90750.1 hypothetical protein [Flavobacterium sp. 7E]